MKNLIFILCAVLLSGCAGARCRVTMHSVQPPVSCTPCVFDASGKICTAKTQEIVRHIKFSKYNWSMLWTSIPLNKRDWDISPEINEDLQETPGNAVVNVTVRAQGCNFLYWYFAALVPIIPSYEKVTVEGDIVKIAAP